MYVVPNYQSCYHSILVNLNEWDLTGKQALMSGSVSMLKILKPISDAYGDIQNNTINLKHIEMQLTVDLRTESV